MKSKPPSENAYKKRYYETLSKYQIFSQMVIGSMQAALVT